MRVYVERLDQRDADTSREFPFLHRAAPLRPTPGLRASESSSRSNGCKCIFFLLASFREGGGEREREVCVFCWRKDDSRNRSIKRVQPKFIHREGMNRPFLFFSVRRRRTTTGSKRFDKKNLKSRGLEASLFTAREAMAEATESVNTGC